MNTTELTWICDAAHCEHETDVRHERGAGVYCAECENKRLKYAFDPDAESAELTSTREKQIATVPQVEEAEELTIEGIAIQHDKSGVGHCWVAADSDNCPPSIQEEIAAEIIDGGNDDCDDYVASNGCHYRW